MSSERQRQLFRGYAAAIVGNGDSFYAARLKPDGDLRCASVQSVFQELFDDCRRTFDHFAGRNLRNQLIRQRSNDTFSCEVGAGR